MSTMLTPAAERHRHPRDDTRPVGHQMRSSWTGRRPARLEQRPPVVAGGVVPVTGRAALRAAAHRASRAEVPRSRPRSPRVGPRRCRSTSPSSRRPRGSRRGSSGRPGSGSPWRLASPRPGPSTFASTCGRWLDGDQRRSWVSGSMATGARRGGDKAVQPLVEDPLRPRRGVKYQEAPSKRSARAFSTPAVSAPRPGDRRRSDGRRWRRRSGAWSSPRR